MSDAESQKTPLEAEATQEQQSVTPVSVCEKATAQLEAYKRCISALQAELAEIEQQFGADSESASDPVKELAGEVSSFKSDMAEIRKMLEDMRSAPVQAQAQMMPQPVQPQVYYQAPVVTPTALPYIPTPNFTPIMPTMPTFDR